MNPRDEDAAAKKQDLDARIIACRRCPRLVEWRERVAREKRAAFADQEYWGKPVPGFGDLGARLLIVGLAPAAHGANRTGRIFTGDRSGDFLFSSLWRTGYANQPTATWRDDGLELTDAYVTSPVRCAPPQNKPTTTERDNCRPFLEEEMSILDQVRVVVALGGFGYAEAARFMGISRRPKFTHGVEARSPDGRFLLGSYHVSQQNTFTGRLTDDMLDAIFVRARELIA
ncbi:MAG: uracil-DNA glycosylase [Microthrixaceae bacterium]